jgi:hypothetical protein
LRAWYRGPFTLHVTEREQPNADGRLPLAHTSDQQRRIVPDGREDLALAAAFEIGRLLAFSQPSVVAALLRWRREQFGAERARQISQAVLGAVKLMAPALAGTITDLGRLAGKQLVLAAAQAPDHVLAPSRPLADPGRPLTFLTGNLDQIIADGFGFSLDAVRTASAKVGVAAALRSVGVPQGAVRPIVPGAANHLRVGLSNIVDRFTAGAISHVKPIVTTGGNIMAAEEPRGDALDDLLEAAARKKGQ